MLNLKQYLVQITNKINRYSPHTHTPTYTHLCTYQCTIDHVQKLCNIDTYMCARKIMYTDTPIHISMSARKMIYVYAVTPIHTDTAHASPYTAPAIIIWL